MVYRMYVKVVPLVISRTYGKSPVIENIYRHIKHTVTEWTIFHRDLPNFQRAKNGGLRKSIFRQTRVLIVGKR